jgi:hypothetical protein
MSTADIGYQGPYGHQQPYCKWPYHNTQNVCAPEPWKNSDGTVDGETVFVKTDCGNRQPLHLDQQDAVYQQPGVPMDRGEYLSLITTWASVAN